jgi:O-acetyl-ADP-ribose deacetylase (regulator of RNase III)
MKLSVHHGNILDVDAEALVCSANPYLNLSGGVGATLLQRFGPSVQAELHERLAAQSRRFISPGELVALEHAAAPYRLVVHAVAVDAFYSSTTERVARLLERALFLADEAGAGTVALTALATGYGSLSIAEFADACRVVRAAQHQTLRHAIVAVDSRPAHRELAACLRSAQSDAGSAA